MINRIICFFVGHDVQTEYEIIDYARHPYLQLRGKCKKCNSPVSYTLFFGWINLSE